MQINTLQNKQHGVGGGFILAVLGVVVLVGGAFALWQYSQKDSTDSPVIETSSEGDVELDAETQRVLRDANAVIREIAILETLKLPDTKFFEDEIFKSFVQTFVSVPKATPVPRAFSLSPADAGQNSPPPPPARSGQQRR